MDDPTHVSTRPRPPDPSRPDGAPCLVVIACPDASLVWKVFEVPAGESVLGRASEATFQIADPGVSRRHAAFRRDSGGCVVVDLDSTNGTFVNGVKIGSAMLQEGDRVQIGAVVTLQFSLHSEGDERRRQALAAAGAALDTLRRTLARKPPATSTTPTSRATSVAARSATPAGNEAAVSGAPIRPAPRTANAAPGPDPLIVPWRSRT